MKESTKNKIKRTVAFSLYGVCFLSSAFCIERGAQYVIAPESEQIVLFAESMLGAVVGLGSMIDAGRLYTSKKGEDETAKIDVQNEKTL